MFDLKWPWSKPEVRAIDYSAAVVNSILAQAQGGTVDARTGSGAQLAASWLGKALAGVELTPIRSAAAFDPTDLQPLARDLILSGQSLWLLKDGRWLHCHPQAEEIRVVPGRPESWLYRLSLLDTSVRVPGSRVLHVRWMESPGNPGQGIAPVDTNFARFAAALERGLLGEASGSSGYLLGLPRSQSDDFDALAERVKSLRGGLFAYEKTDSSYSESGGREKALGSDVSRIGLNPPTSLVELWKVATGQTLEACGVPGSLILGTPEGMASREALRRCRVLTLEPILKILARELSKCGQPHKFRFGGDLANSLTDRARSFTSLVKGGMSLADASAASGILLEEA